MHARLFPGILRAMKAYTHTAYFQAGVKTLAALVARCAMIGICTTSLSVLSDDFQASSPPAPRELRDLMLSVVLSGNDDVPFFNRTLRHDDIVSTYGAKLALLRQVAGPGTMICRGSVTDLEKAVADLNGLSVTFIQYNPEHWAASSHAPQEEIDDPVSAVKRVRALAERHKAKLSFVTDRTLLDKHGEQIAPLVDLFGLQLQRYQNGPLATLQAEARNMVSIVRHGSKTVPIFLQFSVAPPKREVRTTPDGTQREALLRDGEGRKVNAELPLETVLQQIHAVKDMADGIAFLYDPGTREQLKTLITTFRKGE
ncbi:MAG: hypothetical protein HY343_01670 [Lentisphaerae bacterium]|nr:hypothetical protein [Lentisphaerota bacterium]